jgi:hypothetical protein
MTHEIPRNEHYVGGEYVKWEFTVEDDGSVKDLSNSNVKWFLLPNRGDPDSESLIDHTDSGVTAEIVDPSNGLVEVEIGSGVTEEYQGMLAWQRLIIEDGSGNQQIWNGRFPIQER